MKFLGKSVNWIKLTNRLSADELNLDGKFILEEALVVTPENMIELIQIECRFLKRNNRPNILAIVITYVCVVRVPW